ncbi:MULTISPECIES: helix-turn-helix domain-containing protein [Nocardiopsis]|uniref:Helix-turn-helix transcriptional regulator n=1 Tax=Nocardiopsis lambiniae TaxID=3075539 RepID=A0ABU2M3B4_9ACTN|nr:MULTISPECIES: helix-turn-helix transcriptional regulator [unclassified Nocardiopsis]MDE3722503.1 helix-turn-helix transcriptional regulator [Nocardiopsis sp. N85]MDT0327134.1 helix-turn-helix transcriptional regulator [Nocardiopsis sp. DSM 44743]
MTDVLRSLDEARRGADRTPEPLMRDLIGDLLRRTRVEQGRTLRQVAEDAQVSLPYLSEIERGRKEASSEVLAAVYRSLGLSITDVLAELYRDTIIAAPRPLGNRLGSHAPAAAPRVTARVSALSVSLAA